MRRVWALRRAAQTQRERDFCEDCWSAWTDLVNAAIKAARAEPSAAQDASNIAYTRTPHDSDAPTVDTSNSSSPRVHPAFSSIARDDLGFPILPGISLCSYIPPSIDEADLQQFTACDDGSFSLRNEPPAMPALRRCLLRCSRLRALALSRSGRSLHSLRPSNCFTGPSVILLFGTRHGSHRRIGRRTQLQQSCLVGSDPRAMLCQGLPESLLGSSTALCVTPMTTFSLTHLNQRALRPRSTSRSTSATCGKRQLQSFVRRLLTCPHASVQPRASLARHIRLAGSVTLETSRATRRQFCFSPHVQHSRLCLHCQHLQLQRLLPPWRPSVTTSALADSDPTLLSR